MSTPKNDRETLLAMLDSLVDPIVFIGTDHVISYTNQAAIEKYLKQGHDQLVGQSIFDCHNEQSKQMILEIFEAFIAGEDEWFLGANENIKTFVRAVRNPQGQLIGYYERFENV